MKIKLPKCAVLTCPNRADPGVFDVHKDLRLHRMLRSEVRLREDAPMKSQLPDTCSVCVDGEKHQLLHMRARCHMQAPLRLDYRRTAIDRGILTVTCYIPDCARPVVVFHVRTAPRPEPRKYEKGPRLRNDCDLCSDNDARCFRTIAVNGMHHFTAPFRLELHRSADSTRSLHVYCYVEECKRLFAVLMLDDEMKDSRARPR